MICVVRWVGTGLTPMYSCARLRLPGSEGDLQPGVHRRALEVNWLVDPGRKGIKLRACFLKTGFSKEFEDTG